MANNGFNAAKVFMFGAAVGVFALEGYNFLTRDAQRSAGMIPFMRAGSPYSCTADPQGSAEKPCKCTECGMRTDAPKT